MKKTKPTENKEKIVIVIRFLRASTSRNSNFKDNVKDFEITSMDKKFIRYNTINEWGQVMGCGCCFRSSMITALKGKYLKHLEEGHLKNEPTMRKMQNYIVWVGGRK